MDETGRKGSAIFLDDDTFEERRGKAVTLSTKGIEFLYSEQEVL